MKMIKVDSNIERVKSFMIADAPVTQKEYKEVMGETPSYFSGNLDNPVESVSWFDAINFCNKLSVKVGLTPCYSIDGDVVVWDKSADGYRLPTEDEWEYAAKGGMKSKGFLYSGSNNPDDVGWYAENCNSTMPVKTKKPNELDIYDMSGNVWEWCWDDWKNERSPLDVPVAAPDEVIVNGVTYVRK
jgi:formylglycine-generating enzyme